MSMRIAQYRLIAGAAALVSFAGLRQQADPELAVAAAAVADAAGARDSLIILGRDLGARPGFAGDSNSFYRRVARLSAAILLAFDSANSKPRRLAVPLGIPGRRVVFNDELPRQRDGEVRDVYYLTRVGFNATGDTAIIGLEMHCNMVCGYATAEVLVRTGGTWHSVAPYGPEIWF